MTSSESAARSPQPEVRGRQRLLKLLAGQSWRRLTPFLPPDGRRRIAGIGAASFLAGLTESSVLVLLTLAADSMIRGTDRIDVLGLSWTREQAIAVSLALVTIRVVTSIVVSFVAARLAAQVMTKAQVSLLEEYLHTSHPTRSRRAAGDLTAVVVNHARFTGDLATSFAAITAGACGLLAFGGTSLVVNPVAAIAISAIASVALLAIRPLRGRSREAARSSAAAARSLTARTTELESLHRELAVFRVGRQVLERLEGDIDEAGRRYARSTFFVAAIPQLFQAALLAAAVSSLLVLTAGVGEGDLARVGAVILLLIRSMSSAQQLVTTSQKAIEQASHAEAMSRLGEQFRSATTAAGDERPARLSPLRLEHVGFSYDGVEQVLTNVEATLQDGEIVGIAGASGAGKTTLAELLLGLWVPTQGQITCSGTPRDRIDPNLYAARVAFVPQEPTIFSGTVAENVDLFRGLPESRIRKAIRSAHLEAEVDALPDGIHTRIGPEDRSLSGGQRQRMTIARALAGDPEMLVLDEPTSALDPVSEQAIRAALAELREGRIVVVVAHRFSTLQSCDRILVLKDGRLEADAAPDEVRELSSFVRAMSDGEG